MDWLITDEGGPASTCPAHFQVDYQSHIYSRAVTPSTPSVRDLLLLHNVSRLRPPGSSTGRVPPVLRLEAAPELSGQDQRIVENVEYEKPEGGLLRVDAFPLAWRKFVIEYARTRPDDGRAGE